MKRVRRFVLTLVCTLAGAAVAHAQDTGETVHVVTRDELQRAVAEAKPGTTITIAPGTYEGGLAFTGLQGEEGKPIILAAADPAQPPVIRGGNSCLHLSDVAYVELHNLILAEARHNGLNIDDGGSIETPAHHIVLRGLVVRDIGSDGNHDGIKLSGLDDFLVEGCTVERWGANGSGIDMVGCHRGTISHCTFREGNEVGANGVQMKGGSSDVTVRYCRFENAGGRAVNLGGNTGLPYFRPEPQGYEAKDITVEDCTFRGSMAPIAFVGVDGADVRYNTIYRPTRWVIRILQENQGPGFAPCRNGRFTNNIVVFRSDEVRATVNVGPGTAPETFSFAENHWYCVDRPEASSRLSLPVEETRGVYGTDPLFEDETNGDLRLNEASPLRNAGPRAL